MKNWILLWIVRLFRKRVNATGSILVVSTTALGDTLWGTPAIESLRASFPDSYLAVLTSPVGEEVLRHNPWTNKLYVLRKNFFSLWKLLRKERFETVIILHASQRLVWPLCALLGAKRVVGSVGWNKGLDALLTDPIEPHKEHEIVRRLRLIEHVGAKRVSETLSYFLQPHERWTGKQGFVALHPGAKDPFRRWPESHFVMLGKKLREQGLEVMITGSEAGLVERICRQIPGATRSDPTLSLRAFAGLLAEAKLIVTNDTGPLHLACALNVPVIAVFACTDPALFGPHRAKHARIVVRRPPCTPCLKRACQRPFCQLQISPDEVLSYV
jgi:ADP-heptose:LPS heptosyltransferase